MLFLKFCPLINTITISFYGQLWETYRAACNNKIYSNVNCKLVLADWIWVWKNIARSCNYVLIFIPNVSKNTPEMTQGTLIKSLSPDLPLCLNSCHWSRLWKSISKFIAFLAATKQLYEWFSPSVCPSVCQSVLPFWLCSHHGIIMKFSGVITSDKSDVHAKGQGQRSKVKVTEVTIQLNRFRTVTPVWIHMWWWNDAYSLIILRRGALLFLKVIRQISRSHGSKNRRIWPRLGIYGL